jgi:hypothetical protein
MPALQHMAERLGVADMADAIYQPWLPRHLRCGTFSNDTVTVPVHQGMTMALDYHACLHWAMLTQPDADGYLVMADDALLKPWLLSVLPLDRVWFNARADVY